MQIAKYPDRAALKFISRNYGKVKILDPLAKAIPDAFSKYKVTPLRAAHVLAQIGWESDHFKTMEEYASGKAYETRTDLGNTAAVDGDGPLNKGVGLIQRTGKTNLMRTAQRTNIPIEQVRSRLKTDVPFALDDALHYLFVERDCGTPMDKNDIKKVTKLVNGGYNGLEGRTLLFRRAGAALLGSRDVVSVTETFHMLRDAAWERDVEQVKKQLKTETVIVTVPVPKPTSATKVTGVAGAVGISIFVVVYGTLKGWLDAVISFFGG